MDARTPNTTKEKRVPTVSRRLSNGALVELVYDPEKKKTGLAIFKGGQATVEPSYRLPSGEVLVPISAENNLIHHAAVLLPQCPADYGDHESLVADVRQYIARYVDLSDAFLGMATYYVLLSWIYDAFNELPYLRVRGDFGCGKTRALLILGSICCRPFFASGASTVSPIFHAIDLFRGTLVVDEADFRFSDEKAELTKILNNGNVRGFPVLRTSMTPKREFDPIAFAVYGPKLIGMRNAFDDPALESRCITEEMGQRPVRADIPINLPDDQATEALGLRNKLLMYRFRTLDAALIDPALANRQFSHRLNQILIPLLSIIPDEAVRATVRSAAETLERGILIERSFSTEAQLLEVIVLLVNRSVGDVVAVSDITAAFTAKFGREYERPITNRYVGSLIRRKLRLFTYKRHGVYVLPLTERGKLGVLSARYGVEGPKAKGDDLRHGDVGTKAAAASGVAS